MVKALEKGHMVLVDYDQGQDGTHYHYVLALDGNSFVIKIFVDKSLFATQPYHLKLHHLSFKKWQIWEA